MWTSVVDTTGQELLLSVSNAGNHESVVPLPRWALALRLPPDQMEFLIFTDSKPGPGKRERWAVHGLEPEDVSVKTGAGVDVANVDGDVVELSDSHELRNCGFDAPAVERVRPEMIREQKRLLTLVIIAQCMP